MLNFGKKIRRSRDLAGFTQEQLAEAIGVSRSSIAQYESGEKEPTIHHLAAIATTLHVSADFLLGIEKELQTNVEMSSETRIALERFIREIEREGKR